MLKRVSGDEFRSLMRRVKPLGEKLTKEINQFIEENCEPGEHATIAMLTCQLMLVSMMLSINAGDRSIGRSPPKLGEQCTTMGEQLKRILLILADDNNLDVDDIIEEFEESEATA